MFISDLLSDFECFDLSDEDEVVIAGNSVSSLRNPSDRTESSSSTSAHVHSLVCESVDRMVGGVEQHPMDRVGLEVNIKGPVVVKSTELLNSECLAETLQVVELHLLVRSQSDHGLCLWIQYDSIDPLLVIIF